MNTSEKTTPIVQAGLRNGFAIDAAGLSLQNRKPVLITLNHPAGSTNNTLSGSSAIFMAAHEYIFQAAVLRRPVRVLDCAIRFDAYRIAQTAGQAGLSYTEILCHISIQRAFTPYQILDALAAFHNKETSYIILAPCKQFLDGDVALDEGLFLLEKMGQVMCELARRGISLVISEKENYSHMAFRSFFPGFKKRCTPLEYKIFDERRQITAKEKIHGTYTYPLFPQS